jgi:hypothetical protein
MHFHRISPQSLYCRLLTAIAIGLFLTVTCTIGPSPPGLYSYKIYIRWRGDIFYFNSRSLLAAA